MHNKIKINSTSATTLIYVFPCVCVVYVSQMDVSKVMKIFCRCR